jgi:hypothetical protein
VLAEVPVDFADAAEVVLVFVPTDDFDPLDFSAPDSVVWVRIEFA